jgi:hypothetical protein
MAQEYAPWLMQCTAHRASTVKGHLPSLEFMERWVLLLRQIHTAAKTRTV